MEIYNILKGLEKLKEFNLSKSIKAKYFPNLNGYTGNSAKVISGGLRIQKFEDLCYVDQGM